MCMAWEIYQYRKKLEDIGRIASNYQEDDDAGDEEDQPEECDAKRVKQEEADTE